MSEYKDFVRDFPNRCEQLMELCYEKALEEGREVTLLLMVASAGFVVPLERINSKGVSEKESVAKKQLSKYFDTQIIKLKREKEFWFYKNHKPSDKILYKKRIKKTVENPDLSMDQWSELGRGGWDDCSNMTFGDFLKKIRNSLSHGSILARGDDKKEIRNLFFISRILEKDNSVVGHTIISISPNNLHIFLKNWFFLLNKLDIDTSTVHDLLDAA